MRTKKSFTKIDIAKELAKKLYGNTTDESQEKCVKILDDISEIITTRLILGDDIKWQYLMTIKQIELPERRGRNPQTNKVETFPPKLTLRCRPTKTLKDVVCGEI